MVMECKWNDYFGTILRLVLERFSQRVRSDWLLLLERSLRIWMSNLRSRKFNCSESTEKFGVLKEKPLGKVISNTYLCIYLIIYEIIVVLVY